MLNTKDMIMNELEIIHYSGVLENSPEYAEFVKSQRKYDDPVPSARTLVEVTESLGFDPCDSELEVTEWIDELLCKATDFKGTFDSLTEVGNAYLDQEIEMNLNDHEIRDFLDIKAWSEKAYYAPRDEFWAWAVFLVKGKYVCFS